MDKPLVVGCLVEACLNQLAARPRHSIAAQLVAVAGTASPAGLQAYVRPYVPSHWRIWATSRRVWIVSPSGARVAVAVPAAVRRALSRRANRTTGIGGLRVIA